MNFQVLTVSQLNTYIKSVIDGDIKLNNIFIEGEISNFKNHFASGHLYFSLKDEEAVIKCVMFSSKAMRLKFVPENSMHVICFGKISVYPRDGQYQLYAEDMQPTGIGALALAYEQLKKKLEAEGLFNLETKRQIPKNPNKIAVLTSETGAAISDILSITERRNAGVEIILCPVTVQGDGAPASIIKMLDTVYSLDGIDTIILGRGGGSYEDLYCFNDEALVRKIYESPIPVISAVGHETDFTLCDFVADMRAPTPSAAAEIAVPDRGEILEKIKYIKQKLNYFVNSILNTEFERLDRCVSNISSKTPEKLIEIKKDQLLSVIIRLRLAANNSYSNFNNKASGIFSKLEALNPLKIMARGYSTVSVDGEIISNSENLKIGDSVDIRLYKGSAKCTVTNLEGENSNE